VVARHCDVFWLVPWISCGEKLFNSRPTIVMLKMLDESSADPGLPWTSASYGSNSNTTAGSQLEIFSTEILTK
jgi:hypothetical protein